MHKLRTLICLILFSSISAFASSELVKPTLVFRAISPLVGKICARILLNPSARAVAEELHPDHFHYMVETIQYASSASHEEFFSYRIYSPAVQKPKARILHFQAGTMPAAFSDQWMDLKPMIDEGFEIISLGYVPAKKSAQRKQIGAFTAGLAQLLSNVSAQYSDLPLAVYAQSLGGYFFMKSFAQMQPEAKQRIHAVVLESTLLSIPEVAKALGNRPKQSLIAKTLSKLSKFLPLEWDVTAEEVQAMHMPILLISANRDNVVPPSQSDQIAKLASGKVLRLTLFSEEHLFGFEEASVKDAVLRFLDEEKTH